MPDGLVTGGFVRLPHWLERFSLRALAVAVNYAPDIDITDADSMSVILEHRREEAVPLFSLNGRPHLNSVHVESTQVLMYQSLMEGSPF